MSEELAYIHSIYMATEGEGVLLGKPQIFVRFQGCAIGCVNCDSKETWSFDEGGKHYLIDDLVSEINSLDSTNIKRVSITGGDPLHSKHIKSVILLTKKLKAEGYFINIEASGSKIDQELFKLVDFISFDFKTPSTKVRTSQQLVKKFLTDFGSKSQVKAVIANREDFDSYYKLYSELDSSLLLKADFVMTPCFEPGNDFDAERFKKIIEWNYAVGGVFRIIGQQHKWVYGTKSLKV